MTHYLKPIALLLCAAVPAAAFDVQLSSDSSSDSLNDLLRDSSLLVQLHADEGGDTPQEILAAAQADYSKLVGLLYEKGYFGPTLSITLDGREASEIPTVRPPQQVKTAVIRAETGPMFRFGQAQIGPLAPRTEIPKSFRSGEVATISAMRDATDGGITGWREAGHPKAEIAQQQITARHKTNRLDSVLRIAPGPQLRFGELVLGGDQAVRPERIREIAGLPTGEVFHPLGIERATTRLRRTGAFKVAALSEAEKVGPDGTLDINAQIVSYKPRRFGFGAELSTLDGLGLSSFWLHRNLFGGAERLRFDAEIAGIGGSNGGPDLKLSGDFSRPATFFTDTDYYLHADLEELDEESYNSRLINLETGLRYFASEHREYSLGVGLRAARTEDAFGTRNYALLTLPATALRDYRDNDLNPKSGYYAAVELTPFLALKNADDGLRSKVDLRAYKSVGAEDKLTFAVRGQLGSVLGPDLDQAPADYLFYSGGGGTVRGHGYESLGVDIGGGQKVGGRSFMAFSGEVRVDTTDKLSLVGFYDIGYVGAEEFPDGSSGEWHSGAGIGARYDVGIGPIRLDLAVPVSGPGSNSGFEIYIGIGQAF